MKVIFNHLKISNYPIIQAQQMSISQRLLLLK